MFWEKKEEGEPISPASWNWCIKERSQSSHSAEYVVISATDGKS